MTADDMKLLKKVKLSRSDALTFIGKYNTERNQEITVENVTDKIIAFKVLAIKLTITPLELIRLQPGSGSGYVKPNEKATIVVIAKEYTGPKPPPPERVDILLAVAPEGRPDNPAQFWNGTTRWKTRRRQEYPVVFLEEAKVEKGKEAKDDKKDKKEEKAKESGGHSGASGGEIGVKR